MKTSLIVIFTCLGFAFCASAQEKSYSIEVGGGLSPLHMAYFPTLSEEIVYAGNGQTVYFNEMFSPALSLSGVIRKSERTEHVIAVGCSWRQYHVTQYAVFGTDPEGKPRYDLAKGAPAGTAYSPLAITLSYQYRHFWNPDKGVKLYSALGAGVCLISDLFPIPLPSITPIAVRYGGEHFYGFVENTLGPLAAFVHGGIGWHF